MDVFMRFWIIKRCLQAAGHGDHIFRFAHFKARINLRSKSMLEVFQIIKNPTVPAHFEVVLTFEERQKSRYKTTTKCGKEVGWFIPRGEVLLDGEYLQCKTGELIRVIAAPETVSQIQSADQLLLTRAAYHLGNRHVPLQIGAGFLRYQHDHVLDAMVQGFGLIVTREQLPFQPENGAYHGQGGHSHTIPESGAIHSHTVSPDGTVHSHSVSADGRSFSYASSNSSGSHSHSHSAHSHSHSSTTKPK
jgi:urease accessory protein